MKAKRIDSIMVFPNGNVIFFDKDGNQLPEVGNFKATEGYDMLGDYLMVRRVN